MNTAKLEIEASRIARITRVGMVVNVCLAGLKLAVGYTVGSLGLIADGFHSLSDLGTDLAVLIGAAVGGRPPDRDHPYGHGKFETFAAVAVAAVLMVVGGGIAWYAVSGLGQPVHAPNGWWVVLVAGISLVAKEWLYRATSLVAERCRSTALRANAWHHRSDALSSIVVLFGGGAALLGWESGDVMAGLLVGLMVLAVGGKIGFEALVELSEGSAGGEVENRINQVISGFDEIIGWHRLRIRRIGRELMMDIHIVLDRNLTISEGHEIADRIEQAVQEVLDWPVHFTIHIDPDTEGIRRARGDS